MKRTRENRAGWNKRILNLFNSHPKAQLTQHRWQATRAILLKSYPFIENISKETFIAMLSDADYVCRKMRYLTEGQQVEIKKQLAQNKVIEIHLE